MKPALITLLLFTGCLCCLSQTHEIDSLQELIKKDKEDTNKVKDYNHVAFAYIMQGEFDTALYYSKAALPLAERLNFKSGIGVSYGTTGQSLLLRGAFEEALDYYFKALEINKSINSKSGIALDLGKIGTVYHRQGNFPKALDYYMKALQMDEVNGNKRNVCAWRGTIGVVYEQQQSYALALEYYLKALDEAEALNNKGLIAVWLSNIGINFHDQAATTNMPVEKRLAYFDKAFEYYFRSLRLNEEMGNKEKITFDYGSIGNSFKEKATYITSAKLKAQMLDSAALYYNKSLKLSKEIGQMMQVAQSITALGTLSVTRGKYKDAYNYLYHGIAIDDSIGAETSVEDDYLQLSALYELSNVQLPDTIGGRPLNFEQMRLRSKYYYVRYIAARDTIYSEENKQEMVRREMTYRFGKKTAADSVRNAERAKLKEVQTQAELKQEATQRYALYGGVALLLIFGGFMYNRFRVTQKQKVLIEEQKDMVEEKQKEIVDSINYAKRIQYALLAQEQVLKENLHDHFILFKPKDIVSGDFYWATKSENRFYVACCDSTGHGVPGAFMSLLNISFLNEAVIEKSIAAPNEALDHVRKRLVENISQDGGKDGMDAVLLCVDKVKNTLTYAAAYNAPVIIRNGELQTLSCDKMPVGKGESTVPFTLYTIEFQKGDTLYLFTDGYADQFGGPKQKKFKYKQLQQTFLAMQGMSMKEQEMFMKNKINVWMGTLEQVDDILVMGIQV